MKEDDLVIVRPEGREGAFSEHGSLPARARPWMAWPGNAPRMAR